MTPPLTAPPTGSAPGFLRGLKSGAAAVLVLGAAALPARLAVAARSYASLPVRAERLLGGALLDLSAVVLLLAPVVLVLCWLWPLLAGRRAGARWQSAGPLVAAAPLGLVLWVVTVVAQEVKRERGNFPTLFDLGEGGTNASFITGALGFAASPTVWAPALCGAALASLLIAFHAARASVVLPWRPWAGGVLTGLAAGSVGVVALAVGLGAVSNQFSPALLGDPLTGLVESAADIVAHRGPSTPRQLVVDAALPDGMSKEGASRVGWPPRHTCSPHPYARPLDFEREPPGADARGRDLLRALTQVSAAAVPAGEERLTVLMVMLEGFRGDDVHALNPAAPREIAPFMNGLYEAAGKPGSGVLASHAVYQAGVRTAHALGALSCGLGTLPYNLSLIRDLQPIPLRCSSDVLVDAGFKASFFYGSDPTFDAMQEFLVEHHFSQVVGQKDFAADAPKGTWDGITDFAVFDEAVARLESGTGPQLGLLMSLSHHSPFTAPQDLPEAVKARVDTALATAPNRADADDRTRLVAYSYTDAALERLFAKLDAARLSERAIVLVIADHSTGHSYVWGKEPTETDAQKAQVPMAVVLPKALRDRAADPSALEAALVEAQRVIDLGPLSQNDVPAMLLALASADPHVKQLPEQARWHTLGGQVTSPYFAPGGAAGAYLVGINGVSELYALNRDGERAGDYEDSVFLKTRADRYRVTPRLIPVAALLGELLDAKKACP